jgi:hypothetical protein
MHIDLFCRCLAVSSLQSASSTAVSLFFLAVLFTVKSVPFCDMLLVLNPSIQPMGSTVVGLFQGGLSVSGMKTFSLFSAFGFALFQDMPSLFGSLMYSVATTAMEWFQGILSVSDMQILFLCVVIVIDCVMRRCGATALLALSGWMVDSGLRVQAVIFLVLWMFASLVFAVHLCFSCNGSPSMSRLRSHSAISRISAISYIYVLIFLRRIDDSLSNGLSGRE